MLAAVYSGRCAFSLSLFNALAPPLCPSLLPLLALCNLIKVQQRRLITRMMDSLPQKLFLLWAMWATAQSAIYVKKQNKTKNLGLQGGGGK